MMQLEEYMLSCPMLKFFGIPCPGCGGQRSVLYLFQGDLGDAFFMYPAIFPLIFLGVFIAINQFRPRKPYSQLISSFSLISVGFILINYGIELNQIFYII